MGTIDTRLRLNNRERMIRTCLCQDVDRPPYLTVFGPWGETIERWRGEGLGERSWDECFATDKGFRTVAVNLGFCPEYKWEVIEEDENTLTYRDEMGAILQGSKKGSTIPRHLRAPVSCREDWENIKAERLNPNSPERFPQNWAALVQEYNEGDWAMQLGAYPYGIFGTVRELLGVEGILYGFYDDPELVRAMMDDLTTFWLAMYAQVAREVRIDHIHIWEDMSGKTGPLISPAMFREFMLPNYRRIVRFAQAHAIPVISVDTDGNMDVLLPLLREAGVNLVFPFEVQAGCDVVALRRQYPDVAMMGGIDKRALEGDTRRIDAELERIRPLLRESGYIPGLDHLMHPQIPFVNFCYFMERLRGMVGA